MRRHRTRRKGTSHERKNVDLSNKPAWFLRVSPLAKTPVLVVGAEPLFESAVICEYLDETHAPRLHLGDALERAGHRAWIEFASALLNTIWAFYSTPDELSLARKTAEVAAMFARVEANLGDGPYFAGDRFSMVDVAFGPIFRSFDVFDQIDDFGCMDARVKLKRWRACLAQRPSVREAVGSDYAE